MRARHPAPIRFITPRGNERIAFVDMETEAEIAETRRGAFEPLPEAVCRCGGHRRGDGLRDSLNSVAGLVTPATLAGWLRGEPTEPGVEAGLSPGRAARIALDGLARVEVEGLTGTCGAEDAAALMSLGPQ